MGRLVLLPCHSITFVMLLLDLCLLGSFRPTMYFSFIQFKLPGISIGLILIPFWAFSAHFILIFPWAFAKYFRLSQPNYHILYFRGLLAYTPTPYTNSFLWAPLTHFFLLSISYNFHGLTTSFFGLSWARLFFVFLGYFFTILYACGPLFLPFELNGFFFSYFANSSFFTLCYIFEFFLAIDPFLFCQNGPQQRLICKNLNTMLYI